MGMQSFDKKVVSVRKSDVSIAKNYLQEDEIGPSYKPRSE